MKCAVLAIRRSIRNRSAGVTVQPTAKDLLFQPARPRVTGRRGMVGVQGEEGRFPFHLGVIGARSWGSRQGFRRLGGGFSVGLGVFGPNLTTTLRSSLVGGLFKGDSPSWGVSCSRTPASRRGPLHHREPGPGLLRDPAREAQASVPPGRRSATRSGAEVPSRPPKPTPAEVRLGSGCLCLDHRSASHASPL